MIFNEFTLDLTNTLIAIASAVIIYFAWKSTNVREDRVAPAAVLIIENNRRRLLDSIVREPPTTTAHNLSNQSNESTNIAENIELTQNERITEFENLQIPEAPPSLQAIIDEVNDLATSRNTEGSNHQLLESDNQLLEDINNILDTDTDIGPQRIIEIMDNSDNTLIQRRRLTVFEEIQSAEETPRPTPLRRENLNVPLSNGSDTNSDNFHAENCSNENNENENISKTENRSSPLENSANLKGTGANPQDQNYVKEEFRIKLKYLNDELRLVKGSPNEAVGDFKKRNFTVELAAEKLVRLVFNGHVLQPDSKTLQACGLFDNCVVHCLIHNKKPSQDETRNDGNEGQTNRSNDLSGSNSFAEGSSSGASFLYFGIILSGLSIIFGWYCRFTYSFIFSWYSTIGLGIMTVLFLVLCPVLYLIERGISL